MSIEAASYASTQATPRVARYAIPLKQNARLTAITATLTLFQLFAMPLMLKHSPQWAWLMVPMLPLHLVMWGLIHEAIHGHLHPVAAQNIRVARALSVLFGSAFHVLRFGHLMHHRFNRDWESEWFDPARTCWWQKAPAYYTTLFGGLYIMEVFVSLLMLFLPESVLRRILVWVCHSGHTKVCREGRHPAEAYFFKRQRLREVREDAAIMIGLHALAFLAYGDFWPYLAAMLGGRALIISLMDNVHHYATPQNNSIPAWELHLSPAISKFLLHVNYHHTHHSHAHIPWDKLPQAHRASDRRYDGNFWQAIARQLRGPLSMKQP